MPHSPVGLGKYFWGLGAALLSLLAGGWLMLAPFALGYQPSGAAWSDATRNNFWVGLAVVLLAAIGTVLFARSLVAELRAAGVIERRPRPEPVESAAVAPAVAGLPATSTQHDEFERALTTLAAALASDLAERRAVHAGNNVEHAASETEKPV